MPGECYLLDCIVPTVWGRLVPVKGNQCFSKPRHYGQCVASSFVGTIWGSPFSFPAWLRLSAHYKRKVQIDMVRWAWCGKTWLALSESWPQLYQTSGMNWNWDNKPGIRVQHHSLTSKMLWINGQKFSHKHSKVTLGGAIEPVFVVLTASDVKTYFKIYSC